MLPAPARSNLRFLRAPLRLIVLTVLVAGCAGGERDPRPSDETNATQAATTAERQDFEVVRFRAANGPELRGRLWGDGDVAVVLAHGFSRVSGQDDWLPFASALADRGYRVLTFDFRGFCDSEDCSEGVVELGENWRDVTAATEFIETKGATAVFLVGASMGGLAVFRAARMPGVDVAGVVSMSTPQFPSRYYVGEPPANDVTPASLRDVDEPTLFVAGTEDVQRQGEAPLQPEIAAVRFAEDAKRMFAAARGPKELALVDSSFHSSELVTIAPDDTVAETRALIFRFLEANS